MIIILMNATKAVGKIKPEDSRALTGFEPMTSKESV